LDLPSRVLETFIYDQRNLYGLNFRLIILKAGASQQVDCQLIHASLEHDTILSEAASYTWGSLIYRNVIGVDGKFLVTFNLHSELRDLRYPDMDRIVLIVAVCIDLSNIHKRGH
jgi:hypothetical protein